MYNLKEIKEAREALLVQESSFQPLYDLWYSLDLLTQ